MEPIAMTGKAGYNAQGVMRIPGAKTFIEICPTRLSKVLRTRVLQSLERGYVGRGDTSEIVLLLKARFGFPVLRVARDWFDFSDAPHMVERMRRAVDEYVKASEVALALGVPSAVKAEIERARKTILLSNYVSQYRMPPELSAAFLRVFDTFADDAYRQAVAPAIEAFKADTPFTFEYVRPMTRPKKAKKAAA